MDKGRGALAFAGEGQTLKMELILIESKNLVCFVMCG